MSEARAAVIAWLQSKGFVRNSPEVWGIAWSDRGGHDFTDLEFYDWDNGEWEAIVGHHASGTNPRLAIGTCVSLAEVQLVYDTIRRINGYKQPEEDRGPATPLEPPEAGAAVDPQDANHPRTPPREKTSS